MINQYGMEEVRLDDFMLVQGDLFCRTQEPVMSMWNSSISFNKASYEALNDCSAVELLVNSPARQIIVRPSLSRSKDAITWRNDSEKYKYRRIECAKLTGSLFRSWGMDTEHHFKANGRLVVADKKMMLLFDFSCAEEWEGQKPCGTIDSRCRQSAAPVPAGPAMDKEAAGWTGRTQYMYGPDAGGMGIDG